MDKLINQFIGQLKEGISIFESAKIKDLRKNYKNVFISGMGGSGIAAKFAEQIMKKNGNIPVIVSNGYEIPNWVDQDSLAIVSSYSGNTEETLSAFEKMLDKGIKPKVITSGGKILKLAEQNNLDIIKLPSGIEAPRACFGYSLVMHISLLNKLGVMTLDAKNEFNNTAKLLEAENDSIHNEAKEIAKRLVGKIPAVYSHSDLEPVSLRFYQQLSENSKTLAHYALFPELNHNEIVGWSKKYEDVALVILNSKMQSDRINLRIDISKEIIHKYLDVMIQVEAKGDSYIEQMVYLVYLTDWVSFYLAKESSVDPMSIDNINYLKSQIAKYAG